MNNNIDSNNIQPSIPANPDGTYSYENEMFGNINKSSI